MNKSMNQRAIKSDMEFIIKLNRIRAKKEIEDGIRISIPDLTREIARCNSFNELEKELLNRKLDSKKLRIKFDGRINF